MTWKRDGSGLEVKRVRGMTLPQFVAATWNRDTPADARAARRRVLGRVGVHGKHSDTSYHRACLTCRRRGRRNRRAKRQAKAAEKRVRLALRRFLNAVRPMGIDLGPKGLEVLTAAALDVGLCVRQVDAWRLPHGETGHALGS